MLIFLSIKKKHFDYFFFLLVPRNLNHQPQRHLSPHPRPKHANRNQKIHRLRRQTSRSTEPNSKTIQRKTPKRSIRGPMQLHPSSRF